MKKLVLLVAVTVFAFGNVNAQENVVKVNPLALLGGTDLVSYERAFGDNSSGIVSGAIGGFNFGGIKYKSFGAGLQYRYYFDEVLNGFYGGAIVSFQNGTTEFEDLLGEGDSDDEFDFTALGGGVKAGYQWLFDSGFTIDVNLGASYKSFDYDFGENSDPTTEALFKGSGVLPTFGFGIGYGF